LSYLCDRWAALRELIDVINENVNAVRRGDQTVRFQNHIGGTYYVSVTTGFGCVDIHRFYQPYNTKSDNIKPSQRGVALRFSEWIYLCGIIAHIDASFPSLATATPCYYDDDHLNQLGLTFRES